jgi:hypothetical protein
MRIVVFRLGKTIQFEEHFAVGADICIKQVMRRMVDLADA